ncbi:Cullin-associated NEDD8-dissociated protein 1 [Goodea atripinnis]|uniref:Cullin-associated NEDD8-dissociated protein 1 n=1 Tax=Goodea atripinnis TaxID=208336 RepID=A0ABV0NQU5_9TELE
MQMSRGVSRMCCRGIVIIGLDSLNCGCVCFASLGPLVSKVKEYQVETIVDTLCTNMLSDKEQLRDISSIGLKTVIGELPPASSGSALAASVCKKITGRLTSAIAKQEDVSVQLEALDIMADMLCRYRNT